MDCSHAGLLAEAAMSAIFALRRGPSTAPAFCGSGSYPRPRSHDLAAVSGKPAAPRSRIRSAPTSSQGFVVEAPQKSTSYAARRADQRPPGSSPGQALSVGGRAESEARRGQCRSQCAFPIWERPWVRPRRRGFTKERGQSGALRSRIRSAPTTARRPATQPVRSRGDSAEIGVQHHPVARLASLEVVERFVDLGHREVFGLGQHLVACGKGEHLVDGLARAGG